MSFIDKLITEIDNGLKFSTQNYQKENRQYPAKDITEDSLNEIDRSISASLMRINHAGEVSAQGLYRGQALTARLNGTREKMDEAAQEELDHLAWCNKRLEPPRSHQKSVKQLREMKAPLLQPKKRKSRSLKRLLKRRSLKLLLSTPMC
jgi:ubiquinone biosynthesis monooxygenase Coq7